jgi:hypothetical protein
MKKAVERVLKGKNVFHIKTDWLITPRFVMENLKEAHYYCESAGRIGR